MGRQNNDQGPLFYEFCLDEAVPADHLVRKIDAVLDLSWVYAELAPHYPALGRPSVRIQDAMLFKGVFPQDPAQHLRRGARRCPRAGQDQSVRTIMSRKKAR